MTLKHLKFKPMTQNKKLEKFAKLVSDKPSNFLAKLEYYETNKKWLENSTKIAISVLEALKEKDWSQKDLAEKMNVSAQQINKIVKGQQNLTFETVGKLEGALEISLIEIINYKCLNEIKTEATQIKAFQKTTNEKLVAIKPFSADFTKKSGVKMTVVYNANNQYINYPKAQ